jgi:hypothetical protein
MGGTINNINYIRNKRTWGTASTVDMDSIHAKDCYHLFERQGLNGKGMWAPFSPCVLGYC